MPKRNFDKDGWPLAIYDIAPEDTCKGVGGWVEDLSRPTCLLGHSNRVFANAPGTGYGDSAQGTFLRELLKAIITYKTAIGHRTWGIGASAPMNEVLRGIWLFNDHYPAKARVAVWNVATQACGYTVATEIDA